MRKKYTLKLSCLLLVAAITLGGCKRGADIEKEPMAPPSVEQVKVPAFNRDSAYAFVAKQVSFGPRVPGSKGHAETRKWLVNKLKSFGATVREQSFKANTVTIGEVRATNIIASFNPTYARRVILAAHWDTRFAADEDELNSDQPIAGADDGGSGVGVLLEIARLMKQNPISLGVDIILFDAEDQGKNEVQDSWCLGAQYWSKNHHVSGYRAEYGILLDMVGAKGAVFQKEDVSQVYPPEKARSVHKLYDQVWALAHAISKGQYFLNQRGQPFTDDHFYVNILTPIPMIDIIHKPLQSENGFGPHWHTHADDMDVIDPAVLGAVGQVVTAYVYQSSIRG